MKVWPPTRESHWISNPGGTTPPSVSLWLTPRVFYDHLTDHLCLDKNNSSGLDWYSHFECRAVFDLWISRKATETWECPLICYLFSVYSIGEHYKVTHVLTRRQVNKVFKRYTKHKQKPKCTCLTTQFTFLIPSHLLINVALWVKRRHLFLSFQLQNALNPCERSMCWSVFTKLLSRFNWLCPCTFPHVPGEVSLGGFQIHTVRWNV